MFNGMCRYSAGCVALVVALFFWGNPALARECVDCHAVDMDGRVNVVKQMKSGSHHVQGVKLSGKHCYACHWEATRDGAIDERYHQKVDGPKPEKGGASEVQLVLWVAGQRPTAYVPYSTAVVFQPSAIGTTSERQEIGKITSHCLGCHSDGTNDIRPFDGDARTPRHYAWDGQSIASRYGLKDVVTWGKYSTAASNKKKQVIKALSAHGNAESNQGGWSKSSGYDGTIAISRGGANARVECFDCHNSHGSTAAGTTSSYRSFDGTYTGGLLKETHSGKGGYTVTYKPSVNADLKSQNPYNAGAGLCFDCHETAAAGSTPWGYRSTYGADQPIMGYKDTLRFGKGTKGSTARYANRQSHTDVVSSHLKAGRFLNYSASGQINGLCTPCHDPHGISVTLGDKMAYAVPLLKGTWLTSPYREDGPPSSSPGKGGFAKDDASGNRAIAWEKGDFSFTNREANANFGIGGGGAPREPISMVGMKYNIDRNTFGGDRRIAEGDDYFGGLCLKCHGREKFADQSKTGLIHRSVKGWGRNKEHSFPCAKCHQPHNSGLPRLMQTNCFQEGPSGLRESSGLPWLPLKKDQVAQEKDGKNSMAQTSTTKSKKNGKGEVVGCHVRQFGQGSASTMPKDQGGNQWKEKTSW